jgi:hypothetical protein
MLEKQGTGNREQGTGNREQGSGNREQGSNEVFVLFLILSRFFQRVGRDEKSSAYECLPLTPDP